MNHQQNPTAERRQIPTSDWLQGWSATTKPMTMPSVFLPTLSPTVSHQTPWREWIASLIKQVQCSPILFVALGMLGGLTVGPVLADDGDPSIPPVSPGYGYVGIYPNPTLPPDYVKDQSTSPWGLTQMANAVPSLRIGQRFTAGRNSIDWVGLVFQSSNQGGPLGPAEYRVRIAQSINYATGHLINVLGTTSSEIVQMGETGWFLFEFPESIALTPGASYYLAIDHVGGYPGGPGGTGVGVGVRLDNVYSGGNFTGYWDTEYGINPYSTTPAYAAYDLIFCTGVMPIATTTPPAPTLTAVPGHGTVILTWTDSAGTRSYNVMRSTTPGGPLNVLGTTGARFYEDTTAENGMTYIYAVSAVNTLGETESNEAIATPQAPPPPMAPDQLTLTAVSPNQINLAWRDNSSDETGFQIERSTGGTGFTLIGTVAPNLTVANITGLAPATTYTFRVRAVSSATGLSGYSDAASATTLSMSTPPSAPGGLSASASSGTQINLSWTDNSVNETGFKIERSTGGANFSQIATVGAGITTYSNSGLNAATTYSYRVCASNGSGDSGYSAIASATTSSEAVLQQNASGGNKIDIKQGQKGAQSFRHGTAGSPSYFITKVVLRLSRESAAPNANLSFSIGAGINGGAVPGSIVSISPSQIVNTSAGSSFTTLQVTFPTPVGPLTAGSTYFLNLECEASNGKTVYAEYSGNNSYSGGGYFKAGGDDGKDIWFQILGNGAGTPPPTPPPATTPPVPTGLSAVPGNGQISLTWTTSLGATSYKVKRSTTSGGTFATIATGVTSTSYVSTGLNNGTTYHYVVSAVNASGVESPNSGQASATPQTASAGALQQSTATGNKADIKLNQTGSQSFRHGSAGGPSYTISKLVLHLSRESEPPDANLVVSIGTSRNSGTIVGSAMTIAPSSITNTSAGSTFGTFEINLPNPVGPLIAGTTYFINVACDGPNGKTVYLELSGGNTYVNGTYFEGVSDQGKDAWFQVWGQ